MYIDELSSDAAALLDELPRKVTAPQSTIPGMFVQISGRA